MNYVTSRFIGGLHLLGAMKPKSPSEAIAYRQYSHRKICVEGTLDTRYCIKLEIAGKVRDGVISGFISPPIILTSIVFANFPMGPMGVS